MYSSYCCIALGLLTTVAALPAFGKNRLMFARESASGLNWCAFMFLNAKESEDAPRHH